MPNKEKLEGLRNKMELSNVEFGMDDLKYIDITSKSGIEIKIFEDGLIVLSKDPGKMVLDDIDQLNLYYENRLAPALNYIFSLGALVPKELERVRTIYPYFIVLEKATKDDIEKLMEQFDQKKHFKMISKTFEVHRGNKLYIINNISEKLPVLERFIQEHIFMREFRGQMHKYLNLHRVIWEKVTQLKGSSQIKGKNVPPLKDKLESYSKIVNVIESRINQMGLYISTRESLIKNNKELSRFLQFFEFRYEALHDTLKYIKEIWRMTKNYVRSGVDLLSKIQARSTEYSVKNLVVITSMGLGATLIRLLTIKTPVFTWSGFIYLFILIAIGYAANEIMKIIYKNRMYKIEDVKAAQDIQKMIDFDRR